MLLLQVVEVVWAAAVAAAVELGLPAEASEQECVAGAVVVPRLGHLVAVSSREKVPVHERQDVELEHAVAELGFDHLCRGSCC
jgi:hypothetical protein